MECLKLENPFLKQMMPFYQNKKKKTQKNPNNLGRCSVVKEVEPNLPAHGLPSKGDRMNVGAGLTLPWRSLTKTTSAT